MPEIKIKHIVSFSSEDKVHKAENLLKPETYRKWKCCTPGEKSATVVLQFEKATRIHSIDIGNESSAFVEVLVGRSSDTVRDYQVLLVASSFMSPLESRNGTHTNRVRMFGPEHLSQNTKEEKWDCVQVVCTQPFNKNISYGLSFIKFHSPPEKITEQTKVPDGEKSTTKLGAFKLKGDSDEDSLLSIGSWFGKKADVSTASASGSTGGTLSFASAVLSSSSNSPKTPNQNKRKSEDSSSDSPSAKKQPSVLNKDHITYKDVLRDATDNVKKPVAVVPPKKTAPSPKAAESKKTPAKTSSEEGSSSKKVKLKPKPPLNKILDKVVFVLSGFVNPLRSELREKALEMGAKYKADWDDTCTHLVCAFTNTPKYNQVKQKKGHIVTKEWILDCYRKKDRLRWTDYALTNESSDEDSDYKAEDSSESSEEDVEDSEEEYTDKKKKKPQTINQRTKDRAATNQKKKNVPAAVSKSTDSRTVKDEKPGTNSSDQPDASGKNENSSESSLFSKIMQSSSVKGETVSDTSQSPTLLFRQDDESETEDEEALQDYMADTDAEDDSGGDTEDEIRKVASLLKNKESSPKSPKMNGLKESTKITEKPDVSDLPLPELPNLFKQKHFFLFGDFEPSKLHDMQRYIIAYNGVIEDYMNDKVKYVITDKKWDSNFEDALNENEDLIFVRPAWIYKCHDVKKLVPYQPHIVIPDS